MASSSRPHLPSRPVRSSLKKTTVGVKITPQRSASARSGSTVPSKSVTSRAPHRSSCTMREILAHVVVDVLLRQHLGVHLGAVGAAALLEDHGEPLAARLGLREVLPEIEEGKLEPALVVEPVLRLGRLDARRHRVRPAAAGLGRRHVRRVQASRSRPKSQSAQSSGASQASDLGFDDQSSASVYDGDACRRMWRWSAASDAGAGRQAATPRRSQGGHCFTLGDADGLAAAPRCPRPRVAPARTCGGGRRAPAAGRGRGRGCGGSRC